MSDNDSSEDRSVMLYMLAGIGLGALIGAAAGLLFAPKAGNEMREDINQLFADKRRQFSDWVAEMKAKRLGDKESAEEAAAN
jgi:gas vesicle protein